MIKANTSGSSMKLAVAGCTPSPATAIAGKKTIPASTRPAAAAIDPIKRSCREWNSWG